MSAGTGNGDTREHDSDAWETVSGWIWSCRTCLAKGFVGSEDEARAAQAEHVARPVAWWSLIFTRGVSS